MTAPEYRVIPGDTIPTGHLSPERVAEMVALEVLEEAKIL